MKKIAIFAVTAALAAACSPTSGETEPTPLGGAGTSAGDSGEAAGGSSSRAGSAAGSTATGGTASGGAAGSAGGWSAGGSAGATGANAGSSGTTPGGGGRGGSVPVGELPNQIPAAYTGKPFGGTPQQIPGKVEVERYDTGGNGGNGVAFNAMQGAAFNACGFMRTDATALECTGQPGPQDQDFATCMNYPAGSVYIGYISSGNYYEYTVDVVQSGTYVISSHAGVSPTNTSVSFAFTADTKTTALTLPTTNGKCTSEAYHVWSEAPNIGTVTLMPGHYVMTLTVLNAGLNMDWFAFTKM